MKLYLPEVFVQVDAPVDRQVWATSLQWSLRKRGSSQKTVFYRWKEKKRWTLGIEDTNEQKQLKSYLDGCTAMI